MVGLISIAESSALQGIDEGFGWLMERKYFQGIYRMLAASTRLVDNNMRQLKQPIFYLQWILIIFSLIAFGLASIEGFSMQFNFSSKGFQNYLILFVPYSILFAATFIVIASHLAIERLGIMTDANLTAYKAGNRTIWIQTVKEFLTETKITDPYMCKEISKQLLLIHDYLFDKKYKLTNQQETKDFFDKFFANKVQFFEEMNTKFMDIACYRDSRHSYSWDGFRYVVITMLNIDECYAKCISDLNELYIVKIQNPTRIVDIAMFELAVKERLKRMKG